MKVNKITAILTIASDKIVRNNLLLIKKLYHSNVILNVSHVFKKIWFMQTQAFTDNKTKAFKLRTYYPY